ncbi:hypothetical protein ACVQ9Z_02980 [Staphylococcus aureus]
MATSTGCDGVHHGFLAENADFAELCEACQLKFIWDQVINLSKKWVSKMLLR